MDLIFTPEQEAFREEVADFAKREWVPLGIRATAVGVLTGEEWTRSKEFLRKLGEKRWIGVSWDEQYGGLGKSVVYQAIFHEEMVYYGAPIDYNDYVAGAALIGFGSEELKKRLLDLTIRQDIIWCQGYSEPDAGSDLAAVQTTAVEDGDDYVINGSKIWTSQAHFADYIHLLARTDSTVPNHKGLSYFVFDMKSPGISMTPLIDPGNEHHFNQLFFDNVRVPKGQLVGEKNQGWVVAMTALQSERGTNMLYISIARRLLDHMLEFITIANNVPLRVDHKMRHKLAECAIAVQTGRRLAYRVVGLADQGRPFNAEASIAKVFASELQKKVAQTNMEILGLYGQLWQDPRAPLNSEVSDSILGTIPNTIAGGTSEVQRDIIAARGLGLPRR
jgi:alkylation response protein AidB-like acyl-CoA dehydrogenase